MKIFGWKSAGRASSRPARSAVPLAQAYGTPLIEGQPRT